MNKAKLTKQQANAIEYVLAKHTPQEILLTHGNNPKGWLEKASGLNDMPFNELGKALYNGFEVEQQPEDKLIEVYNKYLNDGLKEWHPIARERYHLICQGIKIAVDELGLKIEGINS